MVQVTYQPDRLSNTTQTFTGGLSNKRNASSNVPRPWSATRFAYLFRLEASQLPALLCASVFAFAMDQSWISRNFLSHSSNCSLPEIMPPSTQAKISFAPTARSWRPWRLHMPTLASHLPFATRRHGARGVRRTSTTWESKGGGMGYFDTWAHHHLLDILILGEEDLRKF